VVSVGLISFLLRTSLGKYADVLLTGDDEPKGEDDALDPNGLTTVGEGKAERDTDQKKNGKTTSPQIKAPFTPSARDTPLGKKAKAKGISTKPGAPPVKTVLVGPVFRHTRKGSLNKMATPNGVVPSKANGTAAVPMKKKQKTEKDAGGKTAGSNTPVVTKKKALFNFSPNAIPKSKEKIEIDLTGEDEADEPAQPSPRAAATPQ
jgi:hypothetical protein